MNSIRNVFVMIIGMSLLVTGALGTACGNDAEQNNESVEDKSNDAGVDDAVDYGTGQQQLEAKEQMKETINESQKKKKQQLERVQDPDQKN